MVKRIALAAMVLSFSGVLFAQESRPAGGNTRGNRPQVPNGLGAAMRDMNQVWDRLKIEALDGTKKDAAIADTLLMERDVAIAKTATPGTARNLTGDDKAKNIAEYRGMLTKLLRTFLDLEDAVGAGDMDAVKKLSTQVEEIEKAGHAQFAPKE